MTGASLLSDNFNINGLSLTSITFDSRDGGQGVGIYAVSVTTPEPSSTVALCGLGLAGLIFAARRWRKA